MRRTNGLPARIQGTRENPYAEIKGYYVLAQLGSDTMHIVGDEKVYLPDWAPACGVGFARACELTPYIGWERSRPVCLKCRKIIEEKRDGAV